MTRIDAVLDQVDQGLDSSIAKLLDLIAIPSISNDPAGAAGIQQAANWLHRELSDIGLSARVVATAGHPVVLAHSSEVEGPRLLFYGHYDVQPVGDLADWTHPPFQPR